MDISFKDPEGNIYRQGYDISLIDKEVDDWDYPVQDHKMERVFQLSINAVPIREFAFDPVYGIRYSANPVYNRNYLRLVDLKIIRPQDIVCKPSLMFWIEKISGKPCTTLKEAT